MPHKVLIADDEPNIVLSLEFLLASHDYEVAIARDGHEVLRLAAAFMPHLRNGGIFIPTSRNYRLGDQVYMLLSLMDDPAKLPVAGTVAWVTPPGAQGNKQQGIGVQFSADESGQSVRRKIENLLGNALGSARPTHTL